MCIHSCNVAGISIGSMQREIEIRYAPLYYEMGSTIHTQVSIRVIVTDDEKGQLKIASFGNETKARQPSYNGEIYHRTAGQSSL